MLPVAGLGDDAGSAVTTVTSTSNAISVALSSTKATAEPSSSFTFTAVSWKNGSANEKHCYTRHYT